MLGNDLLEGERVRLTAITREDLPAFAGWFSNLELRRFMDLVAVPITMEDELDWCESEHKNPKTIDLAIRTLDENRLIGTCRVYDIRWQARNCMLGIAAGETDCWGKGYGTDAMRVLLKYCFMEMDLHRVGLGVRSYNARGIKSYRKVGFTQETVAREMLLRDGNRYDWIVMSILRREWEALYQEGR